MLTLIMSPVRAFPSIDEQIVNSKRRDSAMAERSEANAKDATQSFSKEKVNPLANSSSNSDAKPGVTFAAQDKLPKLPIPDLEQTCQRYLASLDPLQSAREHAESERAIQDFLRSDGPELQAKLKAYSEGKGSYIEQFCECLLSTWISH